jgi:hypothetical protein
MKDELEYDSNDDINNFKTTNIHVNKNKTEDDHLEKKKIIENNSFIHANSENDENGKNDKFESVFSFKGKIILRVINVISMIPIIFLVSYALLSYYLNNKHFYFKDFIQADVKIVHFQINPFFFYSSWIMILSKI